MALGRVRQPSLRQIFLVLGENHVGVTHAAIVRHRAYAGQRAAHVLLYQAQRAADAGTRGPLRIGAEAAEAGVQAYLLRDRPVDDDHRERAARSRLQLFRVGFRIKERIDGRHEHRQILRPPARHRQRNRTRLDGSDAATRRKLADHVIARQHGAANDAVHAFPGRRPQRQAVAPQVRDQQVVRLIQRLFVARAFDRKQRTGPGRGLLECGLPLRESVIEFLLALRERRDIAARQEHVDRKSDHGGVGCEAQPRHRVLHDAHEIRPRQRDGRNTQRFYSSDCTAACCGAGPSSRVADDDGIDSARLHEPRGLFLADQRVALRKRINGQHLGARKILLE